MNRIVIALFAILTTTSAYANSSSTTPLHSCKSKRSTKGTLVKKGLFTHPFYRYYIKTIENNGALLTTEDGTVWNISPRTANTASSWSKEDPVVISPNLWWFSPYAYSLTNQNNDESVEASISRPPHEEHSVFIEHIDPNRGYIRLSDGSRWDLQQSTETHYVRVTDDFYMPIELTVSHIYTWSVGQSVLQGRSCAWLGRKHILINTDEGNYLRARCLKK